MPTAASQNKKLNFYLIKIQENNYDITDELVSNIRHFSEKKLNHFIKALQEKRMEKSECGAYFLMHFYALDLPFYKNTIDDDTREKLVYEYGMKAISLNSDKALRFLAEALITGEYGIKADKIKLLNLYQCDSLKENQFAQFEYGSYRLGLLPNPNGDKIPYNKLPGYQFLDKDIDEGIQALMKALTGQNATITNYAFSRLCDYYFNPWDKNQKQNIQNLITQWESSASANPKAQLLSLYLAYLYLPNEIAENLKELKNLGFSAYLPKLRQFVKPSIVEAEKFLLLATHITNKYSAMALWLSALLPSSKQVIRSEWDEMRPWGSSFQI